MRGVAAIFVALFHWTFWTPELRNSLGEYTLFIHRSYMWVDFFFILSGFILYHVYSTYFSERVADKQLKDFFIARFARVYPLYISSLLFYLIFYIVLTNAGSDYHGLTWHDSQRFTVENFFTSLLMLQSLNLHDNLSWNFASWSVSVEFAAYLFFPYLAWTFAKGGRTGPALVIILSAIGLILLYQIQGNLDLTYDYGFIRCITEFIFGIGIYHYFYKTKPEIFSDNIYPLLAVILLLILSLHFHEDVVSDLMVVLVFCLFMILLVNYQGEKLWLLDNKVANWMGDISYSIYLAHPLVFEVLFILWPGTTMNWDPWEANLFHGLSLHIVALACLLAFSHLTYIWIEKPARSYLKKLRR